MPSGMLSSYARYLDLDSASIVEVFDSEYEAYSSSREIEKIANNTRRGVGRFGERVIGEKSVPSAASPREAPAPNASVAARAKARAPRS